MDEMLKLAYEEGAWEALKDMGFTKAAEKEPTKEAQGGGMEALKALLAKITGGAAGAGRAVGGAGAELGGAAAELSPLAKILAAAGVGGAGVGGAALG